MEHFDAICDDSCSSVDSSECMDSNVFLGQESEMKMRKYKMHKKSQFGRSMVEMLGVLSVIGVLSLGGIYGYKYAMKKYLQNDLKAGLVTRAISVSVQMLAGQRPSIAGFSSDVKGYTMTLSAAPSNWNSAAALEGGNYYDEDGNVLSFADTGVESDDKAFSIGIGNLSGDMVEWFAKLSQETGLIHSVVDKNGQDISAIINDGVGLEQLAQNDVNVKGEKKYEVYAVFASDLAMKNTQEINEIVENTDLCSGHGQWSTVGYTSGCACERGYSGDKCENEQEACHGRGYWYASWSLSECICDKGYEGVFCGDMVAYSPCQTLKNEGSQEQRGFKQIGTECEQAGIEGRCDDLGHCVPTKGRKCSSIDGCGEGEFCHFGGTSGGGSGQKGLTPNVCERVNAESFENQGKIYYYNTDKDLRSWCRGADRQANCTWGFLSYQGAQSWCKSLGAELVDGQFIKENCKMFKEHLPQVTGDQQYWVKNQSVVHLGNSCEIQKMSRTDGYAWAGAVVCVKSTELTSDEKQFLSDMQRIRSILSEYALDGGTEFEGVLNNLKIFSDKIVSAYKAEKLDTFRSLMTRFNEKQTLKEIEQSGTKLEEENATLKAEIAVLDAEIAELDKEIADLKREISELEEEKITLSFNWGDILTELFGIKKAYALENIFVVQFNTRLGSLGENKELKSAKSKKKTEVVAKQEEVDALAKKACDLKDTCPPPTDSKDILCKSRRGEKCKINRYISSYPCCCPGEKCYCDPNEELWIEAEKSCCKEKEPACKCKFRKLGLSTDGRCCDGPNVEISMEAGTFMYTPSVCGCPKGTSPSKDQKECCAAPGVRMPNPSRGEEKGTIDISQCGCPDIGNGIKGIQKGENCCYGEERLVVSSDKRTVTLTPDPETCSCPQDSEDKGNGLCCKDGKALSDNSKWEDHPNCCPAGWVWI